MNAAANKKKLAVSMDGWVSLWLAGPPGTEQSLVHRARLEGVQCWSPVGHASWVLWNVATATNTSTWYLVSGIIMALTIRRTSRVLAPCTAHGTAPRNNMIYTTKGCGDAMQCNIYYSYILRSTSGVLKGYDSSIYSGDTHTSNKK